MWAPLAIELARAITRCVIADYPVSQVALSFCWLQANALTGQSICVSLDGI